MKVTCPICSGTGEQHLYTVPVDPENWKETTKWITAVCDTCGGEGTIPPIVYGNLKREGVKCLCGASHKDIDFVQVEKTHFYMFVCTKCTKMRQLVEY